MGVSLNGGTPNSHPKCWSFLVGRPMVVGETHHFRKPHINCLDSRFSLLTWKFLPVFLGEAFTGIFGWLGCSLPTGPWHERCFSRFLGHPFGDQLIGRNLWQVFLSWEGFVNLHFPLGRGTFQWVDVYFMDQGAAYSSRAQVASFWHGPKTPGQESSSIGTEHSGLFGRQNQYLSIAWWWVFAYAFFGWMEDGCLVVRFRNPLWGQSMLMDHQLPPFVSEVGFKIDFSVRKVIGIIVTPYLKQYILRLYFVYKW